MPHIVCPSCSNKLRTPDGPKNIVCPECRKTVIFGPSGEISLRPNQSPQLLFLYRRALFEGVIAGVGLVGAIGSHAVRELVLRPYGEKFPFTGQRVMPGFGDEDPPSPFVISYTYNGILIWGSWILFSIVAIALWFVFWRIKRNVVVRLKKEGRNESRSQRRRSRRNRSDREGGRADTVRSVTFWRRLEAAYKHETSYWVLWGGGTASLVVICSFGAVIYFGKRLF